MAIEKAAAERARTLFSLDTWAVIAALVLALAVKFGVLKNVIW